MYRAFVEPWATRGVGVQDHKRTTFDARSHQAAIEAKLGVRPIARVNSGIGVCRR